MAKRKAATVDTAQQPPLMIAWSQDELATLARANALGMSAEAMHDNWILRHRTIAELERGLEDAHAGN